MRALAFALGLGLLALAPARVLGAATERPAEPPATPTTWVTDRAGFLSADAAAKLSSRLADYERTSGHQLIVYIDRTTGGVPIEDWAARAFERWHVGRRGLDDGAVLFVFADDRRVRIEVGYGLEGRLPDALAGRIIDGEITPRLRANDRDGAVVAGVDKLIAALGDAAGASRAPVPVPVPGWMLVLGALVLLLVLGGLVTHPALAAWLLINIGSSRGGGRGGGWGGGGGFSGGGGRSGGGGASGSW